jgi:Ca-activated chloride channel family protein
MTVWTRSLCLLAAVVGIGSIMPASARRAQPVPQADVACNEPALPDSFLSRAEVSLRVSVTDDDLGPIACLTGEDFTVTEDGGLQTITSFLDLDVPLTVGLVVDASAAMAGSGDDIVGAALAFARANRPEDEFFAIAFNDTVNDLMSADSPFTHQPAVLRNALRKRDVGGRRALYDAVAHGLDHAARGRLDYRALVVISSGHDTASRVTLAQLLDRLAGSPTVVYAIGIVAPDEAGGERDVLKRLTSLTGGDAYFVRTSSELTRNLERIARDIRTSYTIGYVPPDPEDTEKFREVKVTLARANSAARLRYRPGYIGGLR